MGRDLTQHGMNEFPDEYGGRRMARPLSPEMEFPRPEAEKRLDHRLRLHSSPILLILRFPEGGYRFKRFERTK